MGFGVVYPDTIFSLKKLAFFFIYAQIIRVMNIGAMIFPGAIIVDYIIVSTTMAVLAGLSS